MVSSMETLSTQLNGSPTGSWSKIRFTRSRMTGSSSARFCGATIGLTALRCASCLGGSMAMNIGSGNSSRWLAMVIPPSEEKDAVVGVHGHDVVELGHRPIRSELVLRREVDRILLPQPLEERPDGVVAEALRHGRIDRLDRHGIRFLVRALQVRRVRSVRHGVFPVLLAEEPMSARYPAQSREC